MWLPKPFLTPVKIRIFGPLRQNLAFSQNISIFGPFGLRAHQKPMRTRCQGGFSITWVPTLLLPPVRIRIFGPKKPNLVQNMHFWSFWAKYWHFWPIWSHVRPKNNANKVLRCFSVMWVPKLLLSRVRITIFCPKTTKLYPKLAFLVILGKALLAHLVPCWWFWRTGCISQDIYSLYVYLGKGSKKKPTFFRKKS